jgi:hypothetical protein
VATREYSHAYQGREHDETARRDHTGCHMNGFGRRLAVLLRFLPAENKRRFVTDVSEGRARKYHFSLQVKGKRLSWPAGANRPFHLMGVQS